MEAGLAADVGLRVGTLTPSGITVAGSASLGWPRVLEGTGLERQVRPVDLGVWALWGSGGAWSPQLGVGALASVRDLRDTAGVLGRGVVPVLAVEAAFVLDPGDEAGVTVLPLVRGTADLTRTTITLEGQPVAVLSPWELQVGVGVRWSP